MYSNKINILNFNYDSINKLLILIKEKKFHTKQILEWIHKKNKLNIKLMTNLSLNLRNKLKKICKIKTLKIIKEDIDEKNTIKWLFKINKKNYIETVAIPNKKNHFTICISSQIGCMLNCTFCNTASHGFYRNLKPNEIIGQLFNAQNRINNIYYNNNKITNIVFMGMGEPLLNIKNLIIAINVMENKHCYNISKKKLTISTSGVVPEIKTIADLEIPLAISLHATNDNERTNLMPINKKYNIKKLLNACKEYSKKNTLTIEYIMLKDINDSKKHATELAYLLNKIKCKVCLIPFNKFENSKYEPTSMKDIIDFQNILKKSKIITTIRKKMGDTINAACGQLSGKFIDITKRNKHSNL
ncbi:MAG: 23S rRNA (adenine(2503)-C(2))-methyltransferase RlmN [Enterobacteriaceae bacterium]|nr:23S rRNA (adenine(2503)-C(2))-methyltransferase RlmN [Enterobacteriaceae bacterium]